MIYACISIFLAAVVVAGFWVADWQPSSRRLTRLDAELKIREDNLRAAQRALRDLPRLSAQVRQLERARGE